MAKITGLHDFFNGQDVYLFPSWLQKDFDSAQSACYKLHFMYTLFHVISPAFASPLMYSVPLVQRNNLCGHQCPQPCHELFLPFQVLCIFITRSLNSISLIVLSWSSVQPLVYLVELPPWSQAAPGKSQLQALFPQPWVQLWFSEPLTRIRTNNCLCKTKYGPVGALFKC